MQIRTALLVLFILAATINLGFANTPLPEKEAYTSGYIITAGDTLNVFIKQQANYDFGISYKSKFNDKAESTIESNAVLAVGGTDWYYKRIIIDGKSVLAEVVEAGYLTLYKHTEISYSTHHVYDAEVGAFMPTDGYAESPRYYIAKKGELIGVGDFIDYKRKLKKVMIEKPEIHFLIKELRYRNIDIELELVMRRYNELMVDHFEPTHQI